MHPYRLATESEEYRARREELLAAEMALRDQRERVAELRRRLPPGPIVEDYVFTEGPVELARSDPAQFFQTRLSQLFAPGKDSLIIEHFMFAPDWGKGCPMCSLWLDGYNGIARHLADRASLAIVARAELGKIREWGRRRGWHHLRLLSSHGNTFTRDFGMERDGNQLPGISVFRKEPDGAVRHFYTAGAIMGEGQYRGLDLYTPLWNLFDLLPEGRGQWMPRHEY